MKIIIFLYNKVSFNIEFTSLITYHFNSLLILSTFAKLIGISPSLLFVNL